MTCSFCLKQGKLHNKANFRNKENFLYTHKTQKQELHYALVLNKYRK